MKLAICGLGESGKDEAANWLAANTPLRYQYSTSWFTATHVWRRLRELGIDYPNVQACYDDRRNHRGKWLLLIDELTAKDPVEFWSQCLDDQDILVGIRRDRDRKALREAGTVDLWIWIDRPGGEDATVGFGPEGCDAVITNDGDVAALHGKLRALAGEMGW